MQHCSINTSNLNRWLGDDTLLIWLYVVFIAGCIVQSFHHFTNPLALWTLVPLVLLRALHLDVSRSHPEVHISTCISLLRVQKFGRVGSVILFSAALYLLTVTLSSLLQPNIGPGKIAPLVVGSVETLIFLFISSLIFSSDRKHINNIIAILSIIVSINVIGIIINDFSRMDYEYPNLSHYLLGHVKGTHFLTSYRAICGIFLVGTIVVLRESAGYIWYRVPLVASALILTCALVLTQGRAIIIAVVAGIAASINWSLRRILFAVGLVALVSALAISVPSTRDRIIERGDSRRAEIWSHYIDYGSERPLLGYGMIDGLNTGIAFVSKDNGYIAHPHNLVLSAQVRGGILAAAAMIILLFGSLYYAYRYKKLTTRHAPISIIVTLFVAGIFEFDAFIKAFPNWQTVFFWFPIGICGGTELYLRSRRSRVDNGAAVE